MAQGRRRLERALRGMLDKKVDKPKEYKGLLGAWVAGVETVGVATRPDFVYVRLRGATGEVVQAFNDEVSEVFDLPVIVIRDPKNPHLWRISGRDIGQYGDWGGASYIQPHGRSHSFTPQSEGEFTGSDPAWIFKRQYMPLLPRPITTGSGAIYIEADYYWWAGSYHYWPGSGTDDLFQYRPTGGGAGRFVTVYIRGDEGIPDYLVGPEFSLIFPPPDPLEMILVPDPDIGFAIAAVSLQTGTEQIGWQEIYDLRLTTVAPPETGSAVHIYDEGVSKGQVSALDFVGQNVEAIVTGSYAWVSVTGTATTATYLRSGEAIPLFSPTGVYWTVSEGQYVTGSLAVMANGVWQIPVTDFTEQYPESGTFQFTESPETGTLVAAIWGAPVPQ